MKRVLSFLLLFFLLSWARLLAETASVQYELFVERTYSIESYLYVAAVDGVHFQGPPQDMAPDPVEISMDKAYNEPQVLIAFRNNLERPGSIKIKVTFKPFSRTDGIAFTGKYVACMCRYKQMTINLDTDNDGSNDYSYSYYAADENLQSFSLANSGNLELNNGKNWDKAINIDKDSTFSINWGVNATDRGPIASTWYYALTFVFEGNVPKFSPTDFSYKSDYPDGVSFQTTITVELIET